MALRARRVESLDAPEYSVHSALIPRRECRKSNARAHASSPRIFDRQFYFVGRTWISQLAAKEAMRIPKRYPLNKSIEKPIRMRSKSLLPAATNSKAIDAGIISDSAMVAPARV